MCVGGECRLGGCVVSQLGAFGCIQIREPSRYDKVLSPSRQHGTSIMVVIMVSHKKQIFQVIVCHGVCRFSVQTTVPPAASTALHIFNKRKVIGERLCFREINTKRETGYLIKVKANFSKRFIVYSLYHTLKYITIRADMKS